MHELLERYDRLVRQQPGGDGVERGERVIRVLADTWRMVLWSDLDETNADAVIAHEIERFAGLGEWEWKLYSYDKPPDLADRLLAAGFVADPQETLLIGDVSALPLEAQLPPGVSLDIVDDERGMADMVAVHREAFGDSPGFEAWLLQEVRAGRSQAIVARAGKRPISAGRIDYYDGTGFAGLYGGGTVPDWRHRGIFRAVVARRTALAAARGCRYLQVDASDASRPILERLGFIAVGTTTPFVHPGG
jgi:Acetyltransferase (GNAT) family